MSVQTSTGYIEARNLGTAFAALFQYGCIEVRSGPQPANADLAPTGTLLARVTRNGAAWAPGFPTGGLEFAAAQRYILKNPDHVWRLVGIADGIAGWFRLLPNAADPETVSHTHPRIDGAIGLVDAGGDAQLRLTDIAITESTNLIVPHYWHGSPPL